MAVSGATIEHSSVTVSTTAVELCDPKGRRTLLTFTNNGSVTVYLGGQGVTTSAFLYALPAGDWVSFTSEDGSDASPGMQFYGITESSSASVSVGGVIK